MVLELVGVEIAPPLYKILYIRHCMIVRVAWDSRAIKIKSDSLLQKTSVTTIVWITLVCTDLHQQGRACVMTQVMIM